MGAILGGVIGGIGSLIGGSTAAGDALKGFNYLTGKNGVGSYVKSGTSANSNVDALLNGGPGSAAANEAYGKYLSSTGYNFQLKQGENAITGNAASRGLLNSGSTAKALLNYGQQQAGKYFNDYLTQEGAVAGRGLEASGQIGQAGTAGGAAAGAAQQTGISSGFGQVGSAAGAAYNYFTQPVSPPSIWAGI